MAFNLFGGTESELSFELAPWQRRAKNVLESEAAQGRQGILNFSDLLQRQRLMDLVDRGRRMASDELLRTSGRAGMSANIPQGMRDINESGISQLVKAYNDQLLAKRQGAMGLYDTLFKYAGTPQVKQTTSPNIGGSLLGLAGTLGGASMGGPDGATAGAPSISSLVPQTTAAQFGQNMNQWSNRPWWELMQGR